MTNWKCNCGVINFSTDSMCKKCQSAKPDSSYLSQPSAEHFYEHSAGDGEAASGILKSIAIAALLGGVALAAMVITSPLSKESGYALLFALIFIFSGITISVLLYGFAVLLENVVAIRKNTQHLAGIRQGVTFSVASIHSNH